MRWADLESAKRAERVWVRWGDAFELYISQFVVDEASAGDAAAAELRVAVLRDLVLLDLTRDATRLAAEFICGGGVPAKANIDALHIAVASVHGMDYLVSWNCTYIANATMRGRIEAICRRAGFGPPVICAPLELVKEQTP